MIAGPVCTRFLAAYGADVIRVDPPGFEEVGALLPDTTAGKRRVALDLRAPQGREAFDRLVGAAHVVVSGYRSDALGRLGYDVAALRARNPALVVASIDAYGWTGPWRHRRGFDSLVQMTSGIAACGAKVSASSKPFPLPAQALDHGTGYLLAAAVCRALTHLVECGETSEVRASLARTARWLVDAGERGDLGEPDFTAADASGWIERSGSAWGDLERVRCPGQLEGCAPRWTIPPGPLGTDVASWGEGPKR